MRQAVIVTPPGFEIPVAGSVFAAPEPVGPMCAALARGGRRLMLVRTGPAMASDFEESVAQLAPEDDLVVYVAGATTTREGIARGGPALRLENDGGSTVSLRTLSDLVLAQSPAGVIFVVEAAHDGEDDPVLSAEHVGEVLRALDVRARGFGGLVGARPERSTTPVPWPFTRHLLAAFEDPASRDERGATRFERLQDLLRSRGALDADVQSFALVPARTDFPLLEPPTVSDVAPRPASAASFAIVIEAAAPAPAPSPDAAPSPPPEPEPLPPRDAAEPPAAQPESSPALGAAHPPLPEPEPSAPMPVSSTDVLPSSEIPAAPVPEPRSTLPSLPMIEPLLDLAEGARRRGELPEALAGYKAALGLVDPDDKTTLAEVQARIGQIRRAQGKAREAEKAFRRALAVRPDQSWALEGLAELEAEEKARDLPSLRRALDDDPTDDASFGAIVQLLTAAGDWASLDAVYARRVDRLAPAGDVERVWDACRKLAALRRDRMGDLPGAIDAFTAALRCKADDVESRAMLADLHLGMGDEAEAISEFGRIAEIQPSRPEPYTRLFALHRRAGHVDRAWLAGAALEELGSADMDQQLVVDQFRLDGPIRPTRALDPAAWDELLRAPGSDAVVIDVLRAIASAAVAARVEELRQARQLVLPDPARLQGVASTVTAVRSFHWAAQVLGVDAPELFVLDDVPGGIAAIPAASPATALGPDVLRGLSTKDLAFLAARHLTYYRPEYCALVYYPTYSDFSALFLGAVKIALPDIPVPAPLQETVARSRKALARQLTDQSRRRLASAVAQLHARDGRADLASFIRSVELTAQRAGLLLCGDLAVACARLRAEAGARGRAIGELTLDEKRGDLLAFCASEKLGRARELLGVDARRSVSPPAELATG